MLSRRQFLTAGASVVAGIAGVGLYAWRVEPQWVALVRMRMPLENLPPELVGRTLLQISDIHVGPRVDSGFLIETLGAARELAPDFVVLTGDFVSYRSPREMTELARVLEHLPRGPLGNFGALGNHDYGRAWRDMGVAAGVTRVAADAGMQVLRNETRMAAGLRIVGLGDYWSPEFGSASGMAVGRPSHPPARFEADIANAGSNARSVLETLDAGVPTVVLCHNPDAQDEPIWSGVRGWVLAGHTHGGQVKPPFLEPPVLPVRNERYSAGAMEVGPGRMLYINRGLGYLIRVRLNVRPELTLFTLENAGPGPADGA